MRICPCRCSVLGQKTMSSAQVVPALLDIVDQAAHPAQPGLVGVAADIDRLGVHGLAVATLRTSILMLRIRLLTFCTQHSAMRSAPSALPMSISQPLHARSS